MRLLIATDAWQPQVNGVVRTLGALSRRLRGLGATVSFVTPEGLPSFPVPTYPDLRCALTSRRELVRRIEDAKPDAIHIATEGTIGHAVRAYCLREGRAFTTAYMTRFPEYVSARVPIPECWSYALLRRFHSAATVTMVSTTSLMAELTEFHPLTGSPFATWKPLGSALFVHRAIAPWRAAGTKLNDILVETLGFSAVKEAVNRGYETTLSEGVRFERRIFHSLFATEDQKEGMRAFAEKRAADFKHR